MPIIAQLKQLKYFFIFVGVAALMFDISYYVMSTLPGSRDSMCVVGANITPLNIGFTAIMSLLIGILMVGFIALFAQNYAKNKAGLTSLSGMGMLVGTMSVICTACTLPVISLFGFSIWLDFFTDYEVLFKVLSFGMIAASLYLLNQQLKNECKLCVPMDKVAQEASL